MCICVIEYMFPINFAVLTKFLHWEANICGIVLRGMCYCQWLRENNRFYFKKYVHINRITVTTIAVIVDRRVYKSKKKVKQ